MKVGSLRFWKPCIQITTVAYPDQEAFWSIGFSSQVIIRRAAVTLQKPAPDSDVAIKAM